MDYHRILYIPAAEVSIGDVVLTFPTSSTYRVFTGYGRPERETVIECHRDEKDGEIYIKTNNAVEYCQPYAQIKLDCLLTFGKNTGETK